jgi:hypothetical protein
MKLPNLVQTLAVVGSKVSLNPQKVMRGINFWPPFFGMGIKVKRVTEDFTQIDVEMKLHVWNQNYVGTQFGGALYSMCDPFFMIILMHKLGRDYIVWDKAANIRFKKPGRGTVRATFHIPEEKIEELRKLADTTPKVEPTFQVSIIDEQGVVIAEVDKLLYIKRKTPSI